jgi:hypothetical protein
MTFTEFELICIGVLVFSASTFIIRQDPRRNAVVFLFACLTGFLAQLPLGHELNTYTPNIQWYIFHVSLSVIVTWGIGLMSIYSAHLWVARVLRIRSGMTLFFLCTLPIIIVIEFIGSNVLRMKLHNYQAYSPLMPVFNSMHAPAWLYGYYAIIQFLFYRLLKKLGIESENPIRSVAAPIREKCSPQAIEEYD